jgi:succinyl-diaminopimelate desuccinylase
VTSLVDTTAWLIGIPSETGSEEAARDAIAERLHQFDQTRVGNSLVVGDPGEGRRLLVGHLDTVPLQGNLGPVVDGDRLYGLGATDMKAGLAVMIHLLETLGTSDLVAVFYAGEEGALSGNDLGPILAEIPWLTKADAAFVLEPTDREVQAGCNGAINATVGFDGVAAHSARPWLGENAVTKAGRFLEMMNDRQPEDHEVGGLVFREVISVTRAWGGVANNIVPSRFEMNLNYRFAPDKTVGEAVELLREVCSEADSFDVADTAPAGSVDVDHPLFAALIESSGGEVVGKQGWTDVAQLSQADIPAINFGPGETSLAHKPGESVRVSDLDWAYESLLAILG